MERKEILKFVVAIIALVLIAIFPLKVLFTESDINLRLLAIGIILTIVLGGWNILKSLFRSAEAEELKKMNRLKEEEIKTLKFIPLEFWNEVETRTIKNKKEIRNVLYFTNHTKEKIPIEGYYFIAFLKGRDKPLIATNGFHVSGAIIEPKAIKQPIPFGDWFDPRKWHIEGKGTYQIRCKIIYSYKEDTKVQTGVHTLEWEGI